VATYLPASLEQCGEINLIAAEFPLASSAVLAPVVYFNTWHRSAEPIQLKISVVPAHRGKASSIGADFSLHPTKDFNTSESLPIIVEDGIQAMPESGQMLFGRIPVPSNGLKKALKDGGCR